MSECEIDGVRYPVAVENNQTLFNSVQSGQDLEAEFSDWRSGMGITRDIGIPGYFFSAGIDAGEYGQIRLAPSRTNTGAFAGSDAQYGWFFETVDGSANKYVYFCLAGEIRKYSFDGATLHSTVTPSGVGVAGRTVYANGKWYVPLGASANARRLDTVAVGAAADTWADAGWTAIALSTYQQLGVAKFARAHTTNRIALSADTGNITTWASDSFVGDTSTAITDLVETQGLLYPAKTDNLYEFDTNSIARPVIPFLNRANVDAGNGKGLLAFGDIIFYPTTQGLWRYRIGTGTKPVGIDTIRTFAHTVNGPAEMIPMHFRPRNIVSIGEYLYHIISSTTDTRQYILQGRARTDDDPPGHELIWHSPFTRDISNGYKGMFVDSANKLWINRGGVALDIIQLDAAGGMMDTPRDNAGGSIYFPETDLGEPFANKEWRVMGADIENIGTTTVDLRHNLDGATDTTVGATISASGVTDRVFTAGTRGYRLRPIVRINNSAASQDPRVLKLRIKARKAQVYRIVIHAETTALDAFGMTEHDVRNNLSRLMDQGFVNFLEPGRIDTWPGEVKGISTINFQSGPNVFGKGIQLTVERFTSD